MKPMKPEYHNCLADWVKKGGTLVYCGEDVDPYQTVLEWWNTAGTHTKLLRNICLRRWGCPVIPVTEPIGLGKAP